MYKSIIAMLFIFVLLVSGWLGISFLFDKESFPVKQIEMVKKLQEQDELKLQQLVGEEINGGFFSLDLQTLRKKIETLAWVDTVSLRKKWPDTLQLNIREKKVAARWIESDNSGHTIKQLKQDKWNEQSLISDKGVIFRSQLTDRQYKKYNDYAIYSAPNELSVSGLKKCQHIRQRIRTTNLLVSKCFQDRRRSWFIKLSNGFEVYLGRSKIMQRVDIFARAYQQILVKYEKNIEKIDLRYTNGFAIKWKEILTQG